MGTVQEKTVYSSGFSVSEEYTVFVIIKMSINKLKI